MATYGFPPEAFDPSHLPDIDREFLAEKDLAAFEAALSAPEHDEVSSPPPETQARFAPDYVNGHLGRSSIPTTPSQQKLFITAQNDWAPVVPQTVRDPRTYGSNHKKKRKVKKDQGRSLLGRRSEDETREGYLYGLLKWPLLFFVTGWLISLGVVYLMTRMYIFTYEHFWAWRGRRQKLRRAMRATSRYEDWVPAAQELDSFLGNDQWREDPDYAFYDSRTVKRAVNQMRRTRHRAQTLAETQGGAETAKAAAEDLKNVIEACVKNNFVGIEGARLYSQTYYGTKNLVQSFVDEVESSLRFLIDTNLISFDDKRILFKRINASYGRTALCLSGGAGFAYYHFGVVKALLEANLLPDVITGTSGGALVASLVATRTNEELKELLVPALATRITACHDKMLVWMLRWWNTGARFDSVDWAKRLSWWTRGSMTFREAFERTGRILNVSCVPADPHSPTILCNYLTSPDCVIWSAVLASAAVPGILNPVVLMMKDRSGELIPYSFGHKWKDGSLRTDIPIKALNLHFNVNFTIVSQVNPHVNLFFFSSRGTVGSPVTHRKGRGWRGGFVGTSVEQYVKLDLNKWLKVLKHLELLPRPLGQDWSQLWLQPFSGTITIWPQTVPSDFWYILSDPDSRRLARMIHEGQQSCFPKISFISNRLRIERLVEEGRRRTRLDIRRGSIHSILSEEDLRSLVQDPLGLATTEDDTSDEDLTLEDTAFEADGADRGAIVVNGAMGADAYEQQQAELFDTSADQSDYSTGT
ncbi:hypothetical protein MKZ38_000442 [Zalerion maritima]|uniref:Patatin-like phospholipase domain-containing protein n=1 Tax=Zalerion maritima TaxID=339359 RepID=A0AAD5WXP5_9PEZI|nr:hypothetical protein MKZ38_000442 [Zalerion maritima]